MSNRYSLNYLRLVVPVLSASLWLNTTATAQQPPAPRVVDLAASDGTNLKATYFSAGKPGPGVLLLHQCNRQRKVWDGLAQRVAASGLNVLTFDFRGFGESGGTPLEKLSPQEITRVFEEKFPGDVDSAFQYLVSQPGVTRGAIGAGGASCGVNQAVQLARRHPEVKALVLLSEGTDPAGRQFLRESPKLPLFMAAADDDPDPGVVEIMQWLMSLSPNPANRFERYPKGGHGVEMFEAHKELPGEIVAWFDATLATPPVTPPGKLSSQSSARTQFLELLDHPGGIAKAAQQYTEARKRDPKAALFSEEVINRVGYEHLQAGHTEEAVEIMKLNVLTYPNSPNVYDSLSDAYLADGQKDLARQNAKKALEQLASDTADPPDRRKAIKESAEQKLKQLGETPN
jgi:dienelactone hydrolase